MTSSCTKIGFPLPATYQCGRMINCRDILCFLLKNLVRQGLKKTFSVKKISHIAKSHQNTTNCKTRAQVLWRVSYCRTTGASFTSLIYSILWHGFVITTRGYYVTTHQVLLNFTVLIGRGVSALYIYIYIYIYMQAIYLSRNDYQEQSSYINDNMKIKGTFSPMKTVMNCTIDCR